MRNPLRKRRKGPREKLAEALAELAKGLGTVTTHTERSWASITFAGARHRVVMRFEGREAVEAGECFIAFLPEHEFAIPGQLVADAAVVEVDSVLDPPCLTVTCEILLLEEG
ncbi:hypothetical protein [Aurantiacibacter sp. D1-12]|uniref:hypothetical protein n=1 Tax=Aurantiacibacter sp. D1-12 TaxID=2993658 RepID=UPI00237CFD7A|nr:hypothetical protein [Aurantiacibacter sp. D1-12]MDE1466373.1 hypothetical protein [Aurantiacibacter sp. D1-12]